MRAQSILAGLVALMMGATAAQAQNVVVITNASTAASSISKQMLAELFLKKKSNWDGRTVVPVDLPTDSDTRNAFSRRILGRPASAVESYWQTQIFSGGNVPPVKRGNEAAVIEFVRNTPGAIGYVSGSAALRDGVKVLSVN